MPVLPEDVKILRELAREYREYVQSPVNAERARRSRLVNGLTPARPLVWIFELPWHELNVDHQLDLRCRDDFARGMELNFRRKILQWKYFQGDMVLEDFYRVSKVYHSTGDGMQIHETIRSVDHEEFCQVLFLFY